MKATKYVVIYADPSVPPLQGNGRLTLKKMQQHVRGYIERVRVAPDGVACDMIVNEEGAIKRLPVNARATALYHATCSDSLMRALFPPGNIHGDVILFNGDME